MATCDTIKQEKRRKTELKWTVQFCFYQWFFLALNGIGSEVTWLFCWCLPSNCHSLQWQQQTLIQKPRLCGPKKRWENCKTLDIHVRGWHQKQENYCSEKFGVGSHLSYRGQRSVSSHEKQFKHWNVTCNVSLPGIRLAIFFILKVYFLHALFRLGKKKTKQKTQSTKKQQGNQNWYTQISFLETHIHFTIRTLQQVTAMCCLHSHVTMDPHLATGHCTPRRKAPRNRCPIRAAHVIGRREWTQSLPLSQWVPNGSRVTIKNS